MKKLLTFLFFIFVLTWCNQADNSNQEIRDILPQNEVQSNTQEMRQEEVLAEEKSDVVTAPEWTIFEEDYPISEDVISSIESIHPEGIKEENLNSFIGETRWLLIQHENWEFSDAIIEQSLHTVRYIEREFPENIENLHLYAEIYINAWMPEKAVHQYRKILSIDETDDLAHEEVLRIEQELGAITNNE